MKSSYFIQRMAGIWLSCSVIKFLSIWLISSGLVSVSLDFWRTDTLFHFRTQDSHSMVMDLIASMVLGGAKVNMISCYFTAESCSQDCIRDPPGVPGLVFTHVCTDTGWVWDWLRPLSETWRDPQSRGHMMEIYEFRSTFESQVRLGSGAQLPAARIQQGYVVSWRSQGDVLSKGGGI